MPVGIDGWRTTTALGEDGVVESEQSALASAPAVEATAEGARELARCYWLALERVAWRLARAVDGAGGTEIRVLGRGPALLVFAPPSTEVRGDGDVAISFPIRGGLLARRAGGEIVFAQDRVPGGWVIRSTVRGFRPRLPAPLYRAIQRRAHVAVGRRYVGTLLDRAR